MREQINALTGELMSELLDVVRAKRVAIIIDHGDERSVHYSSAVVESEMGARKGFLKMIELAEEKVREDLRKHYEQ